MEINGELLKCSVVLGIIFFVLSHPYLYRVLHRQFNSVMAFVDDRLCPTESGVLVHAILFALIVYFGKYYYEKNMVNKDNNEKNNNNQDNVNKLNSDNNKILKSKCKTYCEKLSKEIQNQQIQQNMMEQQVMPPAPLINNQPQMMNNQPQMMNNQPQMMNNQPQMMNNQPQMMNNQPQMMNNQPQMMNNQLPNDYDNMLVNTLSNNGNSGLSCNSISDFTNQISNSSSPFQENTTYVDDMYATF
jgi:hypothetical protein